MGAGHRPRDRLLGLYDACDSVPDGRAGLDRGVDHIPRVIGSISMWNQIAQRQEIDAVVKIGETGDALLQNVAFLTAVLNRRANTGAAQISDIDDPRPGFPQL